MALSRWGSQPAAMICEAKQLLNDRVESIDRDEY
jgi:hypothetical protein